MFGRISSSREVNKSGTGLGLMISNDLTKRLSPNGAGINVKSTINTGSTFSFKLKPKIVEESSQPPLNVHKGNNEE